MRSRTTSAGVVSVLPASSSMSLWWTLARSDAYCDALPAPFPPLAPPLPVRLSSEDCPACPAGAGGSAPLRATSDWPRPPLVTLLGVTGTMWVEVAGGDDDGSALRVP